MDISINGTEKVFKTRSENLLPARSPKTGCLSSCKPMLFTSVEFLHNDSGTTSENKFQENKQIKLQIKMYCVNKFQTQTARRNLIWEKSNKNYKITSTYNGRWKSRGLEVDELKTDQHWFSKCTSWIWAYESIWMTGILLIIDAFLSKEEIVPIKGVEAKKLTIGQCIDIKL